VGIEKIKEAVKKPLECKAAAFYGCHFLKPSNIKGLDNAENPKMLDELIEATGAKSMPRQQKMMCCGAGGGLRSQFGETAMKFTKENLKNMKAGGAEVIIDVCPFCHLQFDLGTKELACNMKVLHLSQLFGLALGI
jgi:heterodisulfide reductase subunit B